MPKSRPPYPPEFKRRLVEMHLVDDQQLESVAKPAHPAVGGLHRIKQLAHEIVDVA